MRKLYPKKVKKFGFFAFVIGVLFSLMPSAFLFSQTTVPFTTAGAYTWLCPTGVTSITVECWGGGGAGAGANSTYQATGGGGGGAYAKSTLTVSPGTTYNLTVGSGGIGIIVAAGNDGGDSWFNTTTTILAKGGSGGQLGNPGVGGGGGTGNIGDLTYVGGNGASGNNNSYGGGGGASAGTASNGNSGSGAAGGSAVTGGGTGANGATSNASGGDATTLGGGGGGSRNGNGGGTRTGGDGGDGQVIISYTPDGYCGGNAISQTNTNVDNPNNALGANDGAYATFNANGDQLVLDLINNGNLLNSGGAVSVTWYRSTSSTNYRRLSVEVSSNGSTWTVVSGSPFTPSTTLQTINITLPVATRYIRFTVPEAANSSSYINLDGVTYSTPCTPPVSITTGTVNPLSYCAGSIVSVPYTISGTFGGGNTFTAQLSDASGSFATAVSIGSGASPISATIPSGTAYGTGYRIRVVSSSPSATGSDNGSDITINRTPATPGAISGTTAQCPALTNQTYSTTAVAGVSTYTWSVPTGWSITSGAGTNSIIVTTGATGQNGTISVTAGNSCNTSTAQNLAVTVGPAVPATPGSISGTATQCPALTNQTYSVTAVPNATTYSWTVPSGWSIISGGTTNSITVKTGAAGQNGTISVTAGNSCGTSTASSLAVTVNPGTPATPGNITGTAAQCPALTSQAYSISSVAGASTYTWSVPTGWTITAGAGTNSITVTTGVAGQNGSISVTAGNSCGTSSAKTLSVTVNPGTPAIPGSISGTTAQCPALTNQTYSVTAVPNATTYSWTLPTGWSIISGGTTNSITVKTGAAGQNGTISVTAGNSCGTSTASSLAVTVNPGIPATPGNITGTAAQCPALTSQAYSITAIPNATTYTWSVPTGWTVTGGAGTNSITVTTGVAGQNGSISVTAGNSCGTSSAKTLSVTVNPGTPAIPGSISGTTAQCPALPNQTYNVTAVPNATTYSWTVPAGWSITSGTGTNSIKVSTGATGQNGNITVTTGNSCGTSTASSLAVTVNPGTPATPGNITGTAAQCPALTSQAYSITAIPNATTYTWSVPTGWTITTGAGTNSITVTTGAAGQNGSISVTAGNSCGTSSASSLAVTVNPGTPAIPGSISGTAAQCPALTNQTYNVTAVPNATTYTWAVPSGWLITAGATTNTITVTTGTQGQNGNITVTAENSCGTSTASSLAVTVNPGTPAIPGDISGTAQQCPGLTNQTYSIIAVPNATTYTWNVPTGWTVTAGAGTNSITVTTGTAGQNGNITVTTGNSCGTSTASSFNVTVNPTPEVTTANTAEICSTSNTSISLDASTPSTFVWTATATGGITGFTTPNSGTTISDDLANPDLNNAGTVTYSVTPTSKTGFCAGPVYPIIVTVDAPVNITNDPTGVTSCSTLPVDLSVTATGTGLTYQWYKNGGIVSNTGNISGATTATLHFNHVQTGDIGDYYVVVKGTDACANPKTSATAHLAVNEQITVITPPASQAICEGSTATFTIDVTATAPTYQWYKGTTKLVNGTLGDGAVISGATSPTLMISNATPAENSTIYNVIVMTPGAGCQQSLSDNVSLVVHPTPVVTPTPASQEICSNSSTSISLGGNVSGETFSWTVTQNGVSGATDDNGNSITQKLTATGTTDGTVTYHITPTANGCPGTEVDVIITVHPTPVVTPTPASQEVCSNSSTSISLGGNVSGETFSWTVTQSGVTGATDDNGNSITQKLTATGTTDGTVTYHITPTANGCPGTEVDVIITVHPTPVVTPTPASQEVCSNSSTSISLGGNVSGETFSWTVTQSGVTGATDDNGNSITQKLTATGTTDGTVTYHITPTANGCPGTEVDVIITVHPTPVVTPTPASQEVCSNSSTSISLGGNVSGETFSWTVTQNGVSGATDDNSNSITQKLTATGTTDGTVIYHITPTANGCPGTEVDVTITVHPLVTIAPLTQEECDSVPITTIDVNTPPAGTITSWSRTTPSGISSLDIGNSGTGSISGRFHNTTNATIDVKFTINAKAENGCTTTYTAIVTVDPKLIAPVIGNSQILCSLFGITQTPAPLNGTAATGGRPNGYTYQWQSSTDSIHWSDIGGQTTLTYQPPTPTSTNPTYYHLVVTNACGMDTSNLVAISRATDLGGSFNTSGAPTAPLCNGSTFSFHMESTSLLSLFSSEYIRYTWQAQDPTYINSTTLNPFGKDSTLYVDFWIFHIPYQGYVTENPTDDPVFTVTNSSTAVVNTNLYMTPVVYQSDGSVLCNISSTTIPVTINPTATVNDIANQSVCKGVPVTVPAFTSPNTGGTVSYSWSNTDPSIGLAGSGTGNIASFTSANSGNSPVTATITVTPHITSITQPGGGGGSKTCDGTPKTFTITVNPTPVVTATPASTTICSKDQTNIALSSNVTGSTINWTVTSQTGASGASGGTGSSINQTLTATGSVPGTVVYSVTSSANSCTSASTSVTITVNPAAAITSVTVSPSSLCLNATTTATANGVVFGGSGTGKWSSDMPTVATVDPTSGVVTAVSAGTANIIYTITGGCNGTPSAQQLITVVPDAAVTSVTGTTSPICMGTTTTFTANGVVLGNGTGTWSSDNTGVATVDATSGVVTAVSAGSANIIYTINGGCNGTPTAHQSVTVDKNAAVTSVTGGTAPLCIGDATTVTANGVILGSNGIGAWSSDNSGVASVDPNSGVVTAVSAGTAHIIYTITGGCNGTPTASEEITVNADATAGTLTGPTTSKCVGDQFSISSNGGDAGGVWSSDKETVATVDKYGTVTGVGAGTATITYTVSSGCHSDPALTATTTVTFTNAGPTAKPDAPTGPTGLICANTGGFIFNVTAVTNATGYVWNLPSGWTSTSGSVTTFPNYVQVTTTDPSITVTTSTTSGNVSVIAFTSCGYSDASDNLVVKLDNVWTGSTSTDWNIGTNWADGNVPSTSCDNVYIPNVTNQPTLASSETATITNLHIFAGATLTVDGKMTIGGAIDNAGTFIASDGTLEFNGTAAQTIKGTMFENKTVENLIVSNNALNISNTGDTLNITGLVSFGTGSATLSTGDNLTLKSTKDNTASIGTLASGNSVTGQVEVERYINLGAAGHAKTWQYLATPTQGQSLYNSWMEGGNKTIVGYGAQFTGTVGTIGYDGSPSPGASVKYWNENIGKWTEFSNTGGQLYNTRGYFAFIRGDRTVSTGTGSSPTTLRSKGTIFTGDQSFTSSIQIPENVFYSIGNPYPSAVDMTKVQATVNGSSGVLPFIYVWNPNESDGYYNVGNWNTFEWDGSQYVKGPGFTTPGDGLIQSGQAFLIQEDETYPTTVTFKEGEKVTSSSNIAFRGESVNGKAVQLITNLLALKADGSTALADGTLQQFDKSYTDKLDRYDAKKVMNSADNFSIKTSGVNLVVERRAPLTEEDTIQYNMANMAAQNYRLEFKAQGLSAEGVEGFVEDTYLNTRKSLNMEGTTDVDFAITSDKATYAASRFRIVFKTKVVLPLKIVSVTAEQKDANIEVDWKVENEHTVKQYSVEKSIDGVNFKEADTVTAANNGDGSYQWLDEQATPGYNYYRIRIEDQSGQVTYSSVVKVLIPFGKPSIGIYPNPITDGIIHLQLVNQPKGRYGIRLLNPLGQTIAAKQIEHAGGNATENLKWDYNLAHGIYQLEVLKPDGKVQVIKVMY